MLTPPPIPAPFYFNAWILDWVDGDTLIAKVDRGMRDYSTWNVRCLGYAALELSEPGGVEAREELRRRWPVGSPVVLATVKPDKYGGRNLARVTVRHGGAPTDLAALLVQEGWALPWNGKGQQPKPAWPRDTGRSAPPL
jgi:endonuclease YncB( thermonuclease family)